MAISLENKIVLVTGASSGFGADAARLFAREGCIVVLAARRMDRLTALAEEIRAAGGEALPLPLDVAEQSQIEDLVQTVLDAYGRIDILFNNAGFGRLDWLERLDPERDINAQLDVNLRGLIQVTRAVLPHMLARRAGHIINVSSVAGMIAAPLYSIYAATKYGVRAFTDALRREVAPFGVQVSGIYPGPAFTEFGKHSGDNAVKSDLKLPNWISMSSEYVARRAVSLAKRPRRTLVIPWWFRPLVSFDYHFPSLVDWLLKVAFVRRFHKVETAPREAPCGHAVGQAPFRGCFARSPTKRRNMRISRLTKLSESLRASNLDALALNPSPSLTYLTSLHFHISERPVVVIFTADHAPVIILPELEMLKVTGLPYEIKAFPYPENPAEWEGVFRRAVQSLGLDGRRIGVEPRAMRLLEFRHIQAGAPEADFPDASDAVSRLRVRKDPDEIAAMRKAVKAAQSALEATIPFIKIGMTEKEIAGELVVQLLRHGSQSEMPFAPIVSGGPNSANPHASPSERRLQPGDLLVVDWGASVDGYISDLTRTFAIGEVEAEYRKIHQIVLEANAAGRAAAKPGVPCANVDKAAREVIEKAGYGQYFTHRTGHGIGMEGHEEPYMRSDNMQILEPGMAFTVEPGIYLPERGGVRIEDNVVISEKGAECLSDMERELRVVE